MFRWLRRRKKQEADPAAELRAKLEESRAADDRDEFESGETPVDEADPDARRRAVHERARTRMDELSRNGEGESSEAR